VLSYLVDPQTDATKLLSALSRRHVSVGRSVVSRVYSDPPFLRRRRRLRRHFICVSGCLAEHDASSSSSLSAAAAAAAADDATWTTIKRNPAIPPTGRECRCLYGNVALSACCMEVSLTVCSASCDVRVSFEVTSSIASPHLRYPKRNSRYARPAPMS